jgi:hypothetical protein
VKIVSDGAFGRKIVWEQSPLTAGAVLIKNGFEDFSQIGGFGSSSGGQNDEVSNEFPLFVAQIGSVGSAGNRCHKRTVPISAKQDKSNFTKTPKLPHLL